MKPITLPLASILLALPLSAQEDAPEPKVHPNTRPAGEVVLKFERKIEIPEIQRFDDKGVLELFPGDAVHLEFEEVDGELVRPKVVAEVKHPKRSITFKMTQDESITMLFRESEIQKTVAIDCVHRGLGSKEYSRTNLHPTEKGLMAGDSWPNTVWTLRISNIEITSKSASEVYQEKVSKGRQKPNSEPQR